MFQISILIADYFWKFSYVITMKITRFTEILSQNWICPGRNIIQLLTGSSNNSCFTYICKNGFLAQSRSESVTGSNRTVVNRGPGILLYSYTTSFFLCSIYILKNNDVALPPYPMFAYKKRNFSCSNIHESVRILWHKALR